MKKLKLTEQKGVGSLLVLVVMGILAVTLPVTAELVTKSQDNRSKAVMNSVMLEDGGTTTRKIIKKNNPTQVLKPSPTITPTPKKTKKTNLTKVLDLTPTPTLTPTLIPTLIPPLTLTPTTTEKTIKKNNSTQVLKPTPTLTSSLKKSAPLVNELSVSSVPDKEISLYSAEVGQIRCNNGMVQIYEEISGEGRDWIDKEACEYGCDSTSFKCNAECGITEFVSSNMTIKPEGNLLCKAGEVINFNPSNEEGYLEWGCGGSYYVFMGCEAKRIWPIELSMEDTAIQVDDQQSVTVKLNLETLREKPISWATSNATVATVNNGLITANSKGETTIEARISNEVAEIKIKVVENTKYCFADDGSKYKYNESYCNKTDEKFRMVCINGNWSSEECSYGCLEGKCKAGCGDKIFYEDNPEKNLNSKFCELGSVTGFEYEVAWGQSYGNLASIDSWIWKCSGDNLTTVDCSAKKGVRCSFVGGECLSGDCFKDHKGTEIFGSDDCVDQTCCQANTKVFAQKIEISQLGILVKGSGKQLSYTMTPSNTTDIISWSSDNGWVAIVDESGWVNAVGTGKAIITAEASSGTTSSIEVNVVNEDEICSNSNCSLCHNFDACTTNDGCFWKNRECVLLESSAVCTGNDEEFCKNGNRYICQDNRLRSETDKDSECMLVASCNENTTFRYKCGGFESVNNDRYQCFQEMGYWRWRYLNTCPFGCVDGSCLGGYKCSDEWSEQYDTNDKMIGNGTYCVHGCDNGTGRCRCSFGEGEDKKRAINEYACFNNSEYRCGSDGIFIKTNDCVTCGIDKCVIYSKEDVNLANFAYRCKSNLFWGSWSEKYDTTTDKKIGDGVNCKWGCADGKCNCKDNYNKKKKLGETMCLNNVEYECDNSSWVKTKDCFKCGSNGKCDDSVDLTTMSQCYTNGGNCVRNFLECTSGEIISSITSCQANRPICCLNEETKGDKNRSDIIVLSRCKRFYTDREKEGHLDDFGGTVSHGEKSCDENEENVQTCINGVWEKTESCISGKCKDSKCLPSYYGGV